MARAINPDITLFVLPPEFRTPVSANLEMMLGAASIQPLEKKVDKLTLFVTEGHTTISLWSLIKRVRPIGQTVSVNQSKVNIFRISY